MDTLDSFLSGLVVCQTGTSVDVECLFRRLVWAMHSGLDNHRLNPNPRADNHGTFEDAKSEVDSLAPEMAAFLDELCVEHDAESFERYNELSKTGEEYEEAAEIAYRLLDSYLVRQYPNRHHFLTRAGYEREFGIEPASH